MLFRSNGNQLRDAVGDGSIVGQAVVARIYHSTGTQGGLFANVGEFHAVDKPAWQQDVSEPVKAKPAKKAAARTPAAKVAAAGQGGSEDSIPF